MKSIILAAALAVGVPTLCQADRLLLSQPLAGGTLHSEGVDMSAYWTPSEDVLEVVAFYTVRGARSDPQKLRMSLRDGDRIVFGLPGQAGSTYRFERNAETVTVTSAALESDLALN